MKTDAIKRKRLSSGEVGLCPGCGTQLAKAGLVHVDGPEQGLCI
jgi:hypothetical protein